MLCPGRFILVESVVNALKGPFDFQAEYSTGNKKSVPKIGTNI